MKFIVFIITMIMLSSDIIGIAPPSCIQQIADKVNQKYFDSLAEFDYLDNKKKSLQTTSTKPTTTRTLPLSKLNSSIQKEEKRTLQQNNESQIQDTQQNQKTLSLKEKVKLRMKYSILATTIFICFLTCTLLIIAIVTIPILEILHIQFPLYLASLLVFLNVVATILSLIIMLSFFKLQNKKANKKINIAMNIAAVLLLFLSISIFIASEPYLIVWDMYAKISFILDLISIISSIVGVVASLPLFIRQLIQSWKKRKKRKNLKSPSNNSLSSQDSSEQAPVQIKRSKKISPHFTKRPLTYSYDSIHKKYA